MANRFQKNQYRLAYDFIAERDGDYCIVPECHKNNRQAKLQIDHADNNPLNWEPQNLHLLCQKHNLQLRQLETSEKVKLLKSYSAKNVCVRARVRGNPATSILKSRVDYDSGSPEMKVNSITEIQWRDWVLAEVREKGFILREDAVYSGAELYGCSPATIERYLKKLTAPRGYLTISKNGLGSKVVVFKSD